MKAVVLREFGPATNLRVEEIPIPEPRPNEVLIRVQACGVCYHDVINRRGQLPRTRLPGVLGHEICGEVAGIGTSVRRFSVGDRVASLQRVHCGTCHYCTDSRPMLCRSGAVFFGEEIPGGYAEYVSSAEHVLARVPANVRSSAAAVVACTLGTAVHVLCNRASVKPGQSVLITGASGGVGVHAIQLARLLGAQVLAVTSSPQKVEWLRACGAEKVICAPDLHFSREVKLLTGEGVDVVVEVVGSATMDQSLHAVRNGGKLVVVGNVVSGSASLNPGLVILKELEVIGSFATTLQELDYALHLVERGSIRMILAHELRLEEASRAHELLESRAVMGRIVLNLASEAACAGSEEPV
jgi:D-arabinose 1-dehydrogenase-like Zn-dependent alcohol dehydrogenase